MVRAARTQRPSRCRNERVRLPTRRYKIAFVLIGLVGQHWTRSLYNDTEVTYVRRDASCAQQCAACGWTSMCSGDGRS